MALIRRLLDRWSLDLRPSHAWRAACSAACLLGVLGPLACLVALSETQGAALGASLDRGRPVLRARPFTDGEIAPTRGATDFPVAMAAGDRPLTHLDPASDASGVAPGRGAPARRSLRADSPRGPPAT